MRTIVLLIVLALTGCKKDKCFECITYTTATASGLKELSRTERCGDEAVIKQQAMQVQLNVPTMREFCNEIK